MTSKPKPDNTFLTSYTGAYGALTDRGISENTATKFGVKMVKDRNNNVTQHIYPYFNGSEIVGTKTRFVSNKGFTCNGTFEDTGLFGEQLYGNTGGKYLTITEGECDAMAVHELFQGKWSVVSLKRGASSAVKDRIGANINVSSLNKIKRVDWLEILSGEFFENVYKISF